ncbi:iron chaperone [Nocardia sp. NPDC127579]|uniref:iron chaperone n=1 Tax=Nocardia sp. NPDC127579 TaxID=3345402 RepID=UPI00363A336C
MVQSNAATVDEYLADLPEGRREVVTRLVGLCRAGLAGFDEVMRYGMPGYERGGTVEFGFAAQKLYISVYVLRSDVRVAFAEKLAGFDMGKGCLRFRKPSDIDFALVGELIRATAAAPGEVCGPV